MRIFRLAAVLVALIVSGCDPDEQGRPLFFTGDYTGPQDHRLTPEDLRELAARAEYQRGFPTILSPPAAPVYGGAGSRWGVGASVRIGKDS